LPPLNDLFTDKPAPIVDNLYLKPHQLVSQPGIEAFLTHPEFYREDKGQLTLQINVDFAKSSARQVVLASLLNEVFNKQNLTLSDRASRASLGIDLSLTVTHSQGITVKGYTTKHELLMTQLLQNFVQLPITEQLFSEAKDTVGKSLLNQKKNHVYRQLFGEVGRATTKNAYKIDEQLAALAPLKPEDLIGYHDAVKKNALLRLFAVGNYTEAQVKHFAQTFGKILPGTRLPETRAINTYTTPAPGQSVSFSDQVELADSALLQAWFGSKKSDDEQAQLAVLNSLFSNAFFMQLRTNEQLGYVVTSANYAVDDIPGFVMLVQSSNTDLPGIKARMDKFRKDYLATLKATDEKEIDLAKQAMIANVQEKPTDFYAEAGLYTNEFFHAKYKFDGRDRYLAALQKVTKQDLVRIYENLLLNDKSGKVLLQLRGTNFKAKPYADNK
jgi:protease-3